MIIYFFKVYHGVINLSRYLEMLPGEFCYEFLEKNRIFEER